VDVENDCNLAVLRGPLSSVPEQRILESGTAVATLAVRTTLEGKATSVPVTVWDPPAWIAELGEGDELVVLGAVRRRFYRSASGTGSRVDVEATYVGRVTRRDRTTWRRRIDAAVAALDAD